MKLSASSEKAPLVAPENLAPFILVTVLFFLWGVPSNLNDVLIRQFMKSFVLNRFQAGPVQSAFYLGYFPVRASRRVVYVHARLQGWNRYGADAVPSWHVSVLACSHCR